MSALVVNLFGAPCAGKSTAAAYIFSQLKMKGVNCELVTEFCKDLVWDDCEKAIDCQPYIFGTQLYHLDRCKDEVDVIIVDSPLPNSVLYKHDIRLGDSFDDAVMNVYKHFDNLNYMLLPQHEYETVGRIHTEEESQSIINQITLLLDKYKIDYKPIFTNESAYDDIVEKVIKIIGGI